MDKIEIPFGAYDSETLGWTYTIPKGYTAKIEDGKIIVKKEELEDERIRKEIIEFIQWSEDRGMTRHDFHQAKRPSEWITYLEKQKDVSKAIEAVDRIDKYIDENVANAHDMKDSNPNKEYYLGWDDALGEMASILQDVYSNEKLKESLHIQEICKENANSFTDGIIEVRSFQRGIEEGRRREKQKEQTSDIILKAFENSKTDYSLEEREEAIDYSEKVLPTSITYGENEDEYRLHKIIEAAYIAGQKEQKSDIDKLRRDIYQSGYNDGYQHGKEDEQKEQKPLITGNDFGWIDELNHDLEHPEELDQKVDDVLKQRKGIRALEWSEEDRKMIDHLIEALPMWANEQITILPSQANEYIRRLRSLRPQKKIYDGPWRSFTEKKDAAEEYAIQAARYPVKESEYLADLEDAFTSGVEWKEKRGWKPSEEQMKALEEVRTIFHHHHLWDEINPILYDYEELMRDLQKLL